MAGSNGRTEGYRESARSGRERVAQPAVAQARLVVERGGRDDDARLAPGGIAGDRHARGFEPTRELDVARPRAPGGGVHRDEAPAAPRERLEGLDLAVERVEEEHLVDRDPADGERPRGGA